MALENIPEHPSPHRRAVGLAQLTYGLAAAPTGWLCAQIAASGLAQAACFPGPEPLTSAAFGVAPLDLVLLFLSLLISASAALAAFAAWRRTRGEQAGGTHALVEVGEGRSRFMAFAGLLTSLGFMAAGLFSLPAALLVPAC